MTQLRETRAMHLRLEDDGIVRIWMKPGVELAIEDAWESVRAVGELGAGVRLPVLVDIRQLRALNRECRNYYAGPETARVESAVALLVGSPLTRVMGNFFMGINKSMLPTQLFSAEPDALAWLRPFVT